MIIEPNITKQSYTTDKKYRAYLSSNIFKVFYHNDKQVLINRLLLEVFNNK